MCDKPITCVDNPRKPSETPFKRPQQALQATKTNKTDTMTDKPGNPVGRPKKTVEERLKTHPVDLNMVKAMYAFGLTDTQVAEVIGVNQDTINRWKKDAEFLRALKDGKEISDDNVVKALYLRATGYDHPEEKVFIDKGKVIRVDTVKHYPPDSTSLIWWTKNRKALDWKDKREVEHSGSLDIVNLIKDYEEEKSDSRLGSVN